MLQTLHAKGFNTEVQSVDRDKHAYLWPGREPSRITASGFTGRTNSSRKLPS
jgi:hypothetical protein